MMVAEGTAAGGATHESTMFERPRPSTRTPLAQLTNGPAQTRTAEAARRTNERSRALASAGRTIRGTAGLGQRLFDRSLSALGNLGADQAQRDSRSSDHRRQWRRGRRSGMRTAPWRRESGCRRDHPRLKASKRRPAWRRMRRWLRFRHELTTTTEVSDELRAGEEGFQRQQIVDLDGRVGH